MADIAEIQNELNSDSKSRQEFEADPGGYLAKKGIKLPPDQLASLKSQVEKAAAGVVKPQWQVGVTVGT